MPGKKSTSADNQQERLRLIGWISGFTDGEGCFAISIFRNKTTSLGYQVFPEFVITQGEKSKNSLLLFQKFFDCGKIYINRRHDNHRENIYRYCVRSVDDLTRIIIPFFRRNELKTGKKQDFQVFVKALEIISQQKHLTTKGFQQIVKLKARSNRKILRDYTPESPSGDKI